MIALTGDEVGISSTLAIALASTRQLDVHLGAGSARSGLQAGSTTQDSCQARKGKGRPTLPVTVASAEPQRRRSRPEQAGQSDDTFCGKRGLPGRNIITGYDFGQIDAFAVPTASISSQGDQKSSMLGASSVLAMAAPLAAAKAARWLCIT